MNSQTGQLSIKFKRNRKGNLQRKNVCISLSNDQTFKFDNIPDKKLPEDQISIALLEKIASFREEKLASWDVEFELDDTQILRLREQGQAWDREETQVVEMIPDRVRPEDNPKTVNAQFFHNPYNFVPALPRDRVTGELGDRKPVGHGRYLPDYWSGRIAVKLTTVTPLLIPDASKMTTAQNDHKTYPVRLGADGKPYLPPTSLKGMLRSAYEAVTNSRLSVFEKHDTRLGYRMPVKIGLQMVPARIVENQILLYPGTSEIGDDGRPKEEMYAACLPRYDRGSTELRFEVRYSDGSLPEHGDHVTFWAEKYGKANHNGNILFKYWKVRKIARFDSSLGSCPQPGSGFRNHMPVDNTIRKFEGYVYITNKNIDNKHDERVFFSDSNLVAIPLTDDLRVKWRELITDYQNIHQEDIRKGRTSPPALDHSKWSYQVVSGLEKRDLKNNTLCYAHVMKENGRYQVCNLYPVIITRGLYEITPIELLDESLRSATRKDRLSPADRVFGWVNQKGKGSYKGHLRIHSVTCMREDAIDDFGNEDAAVPLTILGQPKPQQARFYCADNEAGKPLDDGDNKEEGYKYEDQGLRGRKVYPHHQGLPRGYWQSPTQDRTQVSDGGHYQEYRRPRQNDAEQLDDQNRSIKDWVKPETEFEFDIDVNNLSSVELGALLWLLSSPDIHYHRIGGGKPLGFGSVWVTVDWEKTDLRKGEDWREYYSSLVAELPPTTDAVGCIKEYKKVVEAAYGRGEAFEKIPFIRAFCRCSKGYDDNAAIHYPRSTPQPTPEGEAFQWFVNNENDTRDAWGLKLSLPYLAEAQPASLPMNPKKPRSRNQNRRR